MATSAPPPDLQASRSKGSLRGLNRMFTSGKTKRTLSLPVTRAAPADHVTNTHEGKSQQRRQAQAAEARNSNPIRRSVSAPGIHRLHSAGGRFRVTVADADVISADAEIPEEDAVCRICFVELEDGETLKMECSCRGEMALVHKDCAVKWFGIKGNKTCEVCKQEVRNLPVTLTRIASPSGAHRRHPPVRGRLRVLQDIPVLVLVSMLAYFCFLEQLLVSSMGTRALALSLPFSFPLGLLSSMVATTMVSMRNIWGFATFQFLVIIAFAHIFYNMLKVTAVLSVLLSSFTGFGIAICCTTLLMEVLRWRRRRRRRGQRPEENPVPSPEDNVGPNLQENERQTTHIQPSV